MLDIAEEDLVVHPVRSIPKRYTLKEVFQGMTPEIIDEMRAETEWVRE